jgi:lipoprotein-anchoring transpeptidase ErfK/SrfK
MSAGARGPRVAALQWRLLTLGFWLSGVDSKYGGTTTQAVMAFQKHHGLRRTGNVDQATANLLNSAVARVTSPRGARGTMFEVDKTRQVGYLIRNGRVEWAVNISTGSGKAYREYSAKLRKMVSGKANTPEGTFRVYREKPSGWWEGELGRMYRPKYIYGGVAVHGSGSVPASPVSHGCIRVSTAFMDVIWGYNLMPRGSVVWVHR